MKVAVYVQHWYYWPHFEPVIEQLLNCNASVIAVFLVEPEGEIMGSLRKLAIDFEVVSEEKVTTVLAEKKAHWYLFANSFKEADVLNKIGKTALIQHGIGPKAVYYHVSESPIEYRFVESYYRYKKLLKLYPEKKFILTGYTKLDPAVRDVNNSVLIEKMNLNQGKKTVLYAPTFYPSTIENMSKKFPQEFSDYNIIIKPHHFTYAKKRYKKQRELLKHWSNYSNVYLASPIEQSLIPFMQVADIMISEASSSMFEFAALDKPIVICSFLKLRWTYRGLLRFRYNKRIDDDFEKYKDIADEAKNYAELYGLVKDNLNNPSKRKQQRRTYSKELVGELDGKASRRIAEYLLENKEK